MWDHIFNVADLSNRPRNFSYQI